MAQLKLTDSEREEMSKLHKDATQKQHDRKEEMKKGILPPKGNKKPTK